MSPTNLVVPGPLLLINPCSGKGSPTADELAAEARAIGLQTHVLREGEDPAGLARASTAEVLGMAGGDGSLAPVAEIALDRDAAFVCIPFGTRNHLARDLGLDRDDPIGALRARLVHRREAHRRRRLAFARVRTWAILLKHRQPLAAGRLEAAVDGEPDVLETPVEFRVEPRALRLLVPPAEGG